MSIIRVTAFNTNYKKSVFVIFHYRLHDLEKWDGETFLMHFIGASMFYITTVATVTLKNELKVEVIFSKYETLLYFSKG